MGRREAAMMSLTLGYLGVLVSSLRTVSNAGGVTSNQVIDALVRQVAVPG